MSEFLSGVKEKYPAPLLKGRLPIEGNIIGCLLQDPLLLDETTLKRSDFITEDGDYYFQIIKTLHENHINEITEVDILSLKADIYDRYEELGGWETIQQLKDTVNMQNFETYLDVLQRENTFLHLYDDGFNLLNPIMIDNKKRVPLKFLRKCTSEEVLDWWESRLTTYGNGYSTKILEDEVVTFTDEFIQSCADGEETGIPFSSAGTDINGGEINCFPFLSNQTSGLLPGTLNMIGGFSSTGKSTWLITLVFALASRDQKVLIISNEESIKKYKIKFLVWLLGKHNRYFKLSKKKLTNGDISEEDREQLKVVQEYWDKTYKGKIRLISINDADMSIVKKKIREAALRDGYTCFIYDTFKIEEKDVNSNRTDLALVHDSRELHKLAMKYNMIGIASIQLAEYLRGTLFLTANSLSNSKQCKEVLENLWLMRTLYPEELDSKSKYFCKPFRLTRIEEEAKDKNGNVITDNDGNPKMIAKWYEKPFEPDPNATWRVLFCEKTRSGSNSSDNGIAYLLKYDGDHAIFRETCCARIKHGRIE